MFTSVDVCLQCTLCIHVRYIRHMYMCVLHVHAYPTRECTDNVLSVDAGVSSFVLFGLIESTYPSGH